MFRGGVPRPQRREPLQKHREAVVAQEVVRYIDTPDLAVDIDEYAQGCGQLDEITQTRDRAADRVLDTRASTEEMR